MTRSAKARSAVWAVTAYYNPCRYRRRRDNYAVFREALQVPLVAVELSCDESYELGEADAEILVRRSGKSRLWQKERLLNIALRYLPPTARYVAWLDCDVVLTRDDWPDAAAAELERTPLIQVFSELHDLPRDVLPGDRVDYPEASSSRSVACKIALGLSTPEDFRPTGPKRLGMGFGWAARRELLERHGLYDSFILGSGDRAIACAAYGRFEDAIAQVRLSAAHAQDYVCWARRFYDDVQGRVGYIEGDVAHLWHGDPTDRQYQNRHLDFAQFGFDPDVDLRMSDDGVWELRDGREEMQAFIDRYFANRYEDGRSDFSRRATQSNYAKRNPDSCVTDAM